MYSNEQLNIIHSTNIGFEFEFFAKENIQKAKNSIANVLNKKIRIEEKAHSDFSPTYDVFKLEPDNSGGTGMIELVTGSLPYVEAKLILAKMLRWIQQNGSTNDRCSIHINISFDGKLGTDFNISTLDIGKFVLNFDEDFVYKEFPNRKNSVYAKSIKFIFPKISMTETSPEKNVWTNYTLASEKYYGINFTKLPKGYLEFRYLGGAEYEKRYDSILLMIHHFINSLHHTLLNPKYDSKDIKKLNNIISDYRKIFIAYKSYENFKKEFTKIKLSVDLQTSEQIIKSYFDKIKNKLFEICFKSGFNEGLVNYDSDASRLQIKDANLDKCFEISDVDLVECKLRGNIVNCDMFDCEISDSSIIHSNLFGYCTVTGCKVENSYVSKNVEVDNSYVFGKIGVFSGKMIGGIFREGRATELANFSKSTEVIEVEKIKNN